MTAEEIQQVQTYIAQLQEVHNKEVITMRRNTTVEQHSRKLAQAQLSKRDEAMREIAKLGIPEPFQTQVGQILNYYCPDYEVPF